MSIFKRFVLVLTSMFVISSSMTILINKSMFPHVSEVKLYLFFWLSLIVLAHNSIVLAKEITTKRYIVEDEELREKLSENNKGSDEI